MLGESAETRCNNKNGMKLAVLFDNLGPYHIARLDAVAHRCDLLAIEQRAASAEYDWESTAQVPFRRLTLFPRSDRSASVRAADVDRALRQALTDFGPEAVAVPGWATPLARSATAWAKAQGARIIVMSASQEIDFERTRVREWVKRRHVSHFDGAIVGGTPHREYLVKLGMSPARIRLGYDVVDNAYFGRAAAQIRANAMSTREQLRLPSRYFLTTARFIEKKNLSRLLRAFAGFLSGHVASQKTREPWHLVILGDGELRPHLENQVASLGLDGRVLMPGFLQYAELPAWYALAEAFVLASTTEQWGLVVNEAMASGLPVLVSNRCGCASDLVRTGVNGYTFDPYDVDALARLLRQIAEDPARRRSLGEASAHLIDAWSPAVFADNLVGLAEELIESPARSPTFVDRAVLGLMLKHQQVTA